MHTNCRAASKTRPPGFLSLNKTRQPVGYYIPQIVNHAHAVFQAIPIIQSAEAFTRKSRTGRAKFPAHSTPLHTGLNPARDPRLRLAAVIPPATRASSPAAQKCPTKAAIHAARGDEHGLNRVLSCSAFRHCLAASAEGRASHKALATPSCYPSALNASWKVTVPCGVCPSKDRAKKTSGGTPSCPSPATFWNPNFR